MVALVLAWLAILFAALAIPTVLPQLVGVDVVPYAVSGTFVALGMLAAVCSWALACAAVVAASIRLIRRGRDRRSLITLGLAGPGAVLGTAVLVFVIVLLGNTFGVFGGNRAEDLARPAVNTYISEGASLICENGDGGNGPVNRTPWFTAYLDIPDSFGGADNAVEALSRAGYETASIDPGAELPPGSFSVRSGAADNSARIDVHPRGPARLLCTSNGIEYGTDYRPSDGRLLVVVQVSLPRTD